MMQRNNAFTQKQVSLKHLEVSMPDFQVSLGFFASVVSSVFTFECPFQNIV